MNYKVDVIFSVNEGFSTRNHKPQDRIISSPIASNKTKKKGGLRIAISFSSKIKEEEKIPKTRRVFLLTIHSIFQSLLIIIYY